MVFLNPNQIWRMQDSTQAQNLASRFSQLLFLIEPNGVQAHRVC